MLYQLIASATDQVTPLSKVAHDTSFTFSSFLGDIRTALIKMANDFAGLIPKILLGVVLLFLGFVFAKIIAKSISILFERLGINALLTKSGITETLSKAGFKASPGECLAKIAFLLSMLFVVKIAAQEASFSDISDLIIKIIAFMPNVITAAIILIIGFLIADVSRNSVFRALTAAGLEYARTVSKLIFGFIIIIILTVALAQINIQTELLNATVKIVLAATGLALALALGIGLKGTTKNVVSGVYSRDLYKVGTEIQYEGEWMTIAGIGPVTTKLNKSDGGFLILPNDKLVSEPVRGRSAN